MKKPFNIVIDRGKGTAKALNKFVAMEADHLREVENF